MNNKQNEIGGNFYETWYEYEPYIRKLCAYKLQSMPECVDDCVQDVFTAYLTAVGKSQKIENIRNWLTGVAHNKIVDLYGKHRRESEIFVPITQEVKEKEASFDEYVTEEEITAHTEEILNTLTAYERELLDDFYVKRIKQKTMAEKRGISENLIQQQVFRMKRKIIKNTRLLLDGELHKEKPKSL